MRLHAQAGWGIDWRERERDRWRWSIDPAALSSMQPVSALSLPLSRARALLQLLMRVLYCISFILLHTQVLFNMQRLSSASSVRSQFRAGYTQLRTCFQQWPTLFGGKPCTFCNYRRGVTSPRRSADRRRYVAVGLRLCSCLVNNPVRSSSCGLTVFSGSPKCETTILLGFAYTLFETRY